MDMLAVAHWLIGAAGARTPGSVARVNGSGAGALGRDPAAARLAGFAKEVGKGGGGSSDEPTVCMTLLPAAAGVAYVAWRSLRRRPRPVPGFAPGS